MLYAPARRWRSNPVPRELPPATPPFGHFIELELHGSGNGWTSVSRDVLQRAHIRLRYGIQGSGPTDLLASTGLLNFALDNSERNSAGILAYYTPDGASCRAGFRRGIGVRYRYRVPNTYRYYTKFAGWLEAADPTPGRYLDRRTLCSAADWMNEAAKIRPTIPTQVNKRADEVFAAVVAAVPRQPRFLDLDVAESTFPFALDNSQTEKHTALAELQRLCQSEFSRAYLRGGLNTPGMTLKFENRSARLTPTPVAQFTGTMQGFKPASKLRNKAKVTAHPRVVGPNNQQVLVDKPNQNNPPIAPGETIKIVSRYTDPDDRASRVGATDYQTPAQTTDYLFNAAQDGSGADLTANLSVIANFGGNQVEHEIKNNGVTLGYLTRLKARGQTLLDYAPFDAEKVDQASIDEIGETPIVLDMPYQSDLSVAQAVAEFLILTWATPGASEARLRFTPSDVAEMELAMSLEPGDPIGVSEILTGVNGVYYIQDVAIDVEDADLRTVFEWGLQRTLADEYAQLDSHSLDVDAILAPL